MVEKVLRFCDPDYRKKLVGRQKLTGDWNDQAACNEHAPLFSSRSFIQLDVRIMTGKETKLLDAQDREAANKALGECDHPEEHDQEVGGESGEELVCAPKDLPGRLLVKAADVACKINPVNAPFPAFAQAAAGFQVLEPNVLRCSPRNTGVLRRAS